MVSLELPPWKKDRLAENKFKKIAQSKKLKSLNFQAQTNFFKPKTIQTLKSLLTVFQYNTNNAKRTQEKQFLGLKK